MGILRDPMWQFFGVILALITIIATIFVPMKLRSRKQLSYEIISKTPVLSLKESIHGKLEIIYDGTPVRDVHLLHLSILNSGNVPITTNDYEKPISITTEKGEILSAEIFETVPKALETNISLNDNKIKLDEMLLNPGDTLTFRILINEFSGDIIVTGRVVGVTDLSQRKESRALVLISIIVGMIVSGCSMWKFTNIMPQETSMPHDSGWYLASFVLGYIIMILGMMSNKKSRKFLGVFNSLIRKTF